MRAYKLCEKCSERQGAERKVFEVVPGRQCYICEGAMDKTEKVGALAARKVRPFEFVTFAVGVSLQEGVQEREDELRSDFRLRGVETIKTQAARLVASTASRVTGKRVDKGRPDVVILADFAKGEVSISSRPAFYYARYVKPAGVSQRRRICEDCRGSGCKSCRNTGFERKPSVEEVLRRKLGEFAGSDRIVISWLGSEDEGSRVFPPGRPFVAEVKNPTKRRYPRRFGGRVKGGLVSVSAGRMLPSKPVRLPPFRFRTLIRAESASKVSPDSLKDLRTAFRKATVTFARPRSRPAFKTVYRVAATAKGRSLFIDAEMDGGLPVKRFVSGELVSPSVSEVLKTEVGCRSFDIRGVRETGELGFAEIARDEEKN